APEAERTRDGLAAVFRFLDEDRRRGVVLFGSGITNPVLLSRREGMRHVLVAFADEATGYQAAEAKDPTIDAAAAAALVGAGQELIRGWLDGDIDADADRMADITATMLVHLLAGAAG